MSVLQLLRWLKTIHVWLHHRIKMFVSAKVLSITYLKELAFTKCFVYFSSPATKVFNSGLKVSQKLKAFERILRVCLHTSMVQNFGLTTVYLSIYKQPFLVFLQAFLFQKSDASGLPANVSNF